MINLRRNTTIIVLVVMISLALSLNFSAIEIMEGDNLQLVTVHSKTFEPIEALTMNTYLRTSSDTIEHQIYVAAGCYECPEAVVGWTPVYDDSIGFGPNAARVIKRYPASCWNRHSTTNHGAAFFDVIIP